MLRTLVFLLFLFFFLIRVKLEISKYKIPYFQLDRDDVYPNVWLLLRISLLTHVRVENYCKFLNASYKWQFYSPESEILSWNRLGNFQLKCMNCSSTIFFLFLQVRFPGWERVITMLQGHHHVKQLEGKVKFWAMLSFDVVPQECFQRDADLPTFLLTGTKRQWKH